MSWIAMYHVDRTSGIQERVRLRHIRYQLWLGCNVTIRIGLTGAAATAMVCSTRYIRLRQSLGVSSGLCVGTYGMSIAYARTCTIWVGLVAAFGGLERHSFRPQLRRHAAMTEPGRAPCTCILLSKSALHLAAMPSNSKPPSVRRDCRVEPGTRNVAPRHIKYVTAVVICCVHSRGAGRTCATYHNRASKYTWT